MNIMNLAEKKINKHSDIKIHKLCAIAMTKNGHLVATATNKKASGIVSDFSYHAEEYLIRKLRKINAIHRYRDIIVVILRRSRSGWRNARPCIRCEGLLLGYGVKEIHHTDNFGRIVQFI